MYFYHGDCSSYIYLVLPSFLRFHPVKLAFTYFYWVSPSFSPSVADFYQVILGLIYLYLILPGTI